MSLSRRRLLTSAALLGAGGVLAACGDDAQAKPPPWHDGRLFIATGNTTGVFYQIGGGLADLITRYVPGYEAHAESSGASGENIQRVASGDFDLGFANGDTTADAVTGKGAGHNAATPSSDDVLARLEKEVDLVITGSAD